MSRESDEREFMAEVDRMFPYQDDSGVACFLRWFAVDGQWTCEGHHDQPGNEHVVTSADLKEAIHDVMESVKEEYAPESVGFYVDEIYL